MPSSYRKIKHTLKRKPSITYQVSWVILFILAISSFYSWFFVDFNLGNVKLVWISVFLGLLLAWGISYIIERLFPEIAYREKSKKPNIGTLILVILICNLPVLVQRVNREFWNGTEICNKYKVLDKTYISYYRRTTCNFKVLIENEKKVIDCEKSTFDRIIVNNEIEICIVKGGLGFEYVKVIKP